MARVTNAPTTHKRRKRRLKQARGFYGARHRLYKKATEAVNKSMAFNYVGRKQKKRQYRRLWITRINAACRMNDIKYSRLIEGLNKANVKLNRKMLAEIAVQDESGFKSIVEIAKKNIA